MGPLENVRDMHSPRVRSPRLGQNTLQIIRQSSKHTLELSLVFPIQLMKKAPPKSPPQPLTKNMSSRAFHYRTKQCRLEWQVRCFEDKFVLWVWRFGKRVGTEPFVATCLGVGRTQETLVSLSLSLFPLFCFFLLLYEYFVFIF